MGKEVNSQIPSNDPYDMYENDEEEEEEEENNNKSNNHNYGPLKSAVEF